MKNQTWIKTQLSTIEQTLVNAILRRWSKTVRTLNDSVKYLASDLTPVNNNSNNKT